MKKNIILLSVAAAVFSSFCPADGYRVTGTVKGSHDGDTVKMLIFKGWDAVTLGTAIIKNGEYTLTGRQDTAAMRYLSCASGGKSLGMAQFVLENGDTRVNLDSATFAYDIKGSKVNEDWCSFHNREEQLCGESLDLYRALQDSTIDKAVAAAKRREMEAKDAELNAFRLKYCEDNIGNVAGAYVLAANARYFNEADVYRLLDKVPASVNDPLVLALKEDAKSKRQTAVNRPFTDFTMKTPEGKNLSISEVAKKNKVTMIDFWASWCGPCRAEMPAVKAAYAKYHAKGFEIIGVSLDSDGKAWRKAIRTLGLTWPQVSDLKGWQCAGAEMYGVKAIPATVLIMDGKIIARNLRGDDIEKKLAEILK